MAGTICLGGLALTIGLAAVLSNFYQHQLEQRFDAVAKDRARSMQDDFAARTHELDGIRRFFVNADQVTRSEFTGYVGDLPQHAFSYAWVPRVTDSQRQAFEAGAVTLGVPGLQIRDWVSRGVLQVAGRRAEYFPILFIDSRHLKAEQVLGLDIAALPERLNTLQRAGQGGNMTASGVLRFLATSVAEDGLVLAAPVYRGAMPEDPAQRQGAALRGYVLASFSLQQLLSGHENSEDALSLSLELRDISGLDGQKLHYRSAQESAPESRLLHSRELQLADRRYTLTIRPSALFLQANTTPGGLAIVLTSGMLLTLLLAALLFSLVSQRQRAQLLVREKTAALRQRQSELAQVNSQLRGVLDSATQVSIIATDLDGIIQTFNVGAERMLGYRAEDMIGQATPERIHLAAEVQQRSRDISLKLGRPVSGFEVFVAEASGQQGHVEREWTYVRQDGSQLVVNLIVTGVRDADAQLVGYLGIAIDITAARHSREALEARDELLEKLTANVPGAIYQYQLNTDGTSCFPYASLGLRALYELEPESLRQNGEAVFQRIHPEDLDGVKRSVLTSAEQLTPWREEYRVLLPRQGLRWLRGEASPERLSDGRVLWHGYLTDVTGPKLVEQELRTLSITDTLTGAYNRRYFQERLEMEISRAKRQSAQGPAVVMLDIDHFKLINDRFGHDTGDQVLKAVCERIRQRLRNIDVFCRLGGEEFIVLAPATSEDQAMILAEALWQILRNEPVDGVGIVTASFGVTAWRPGESSAALLSRVDAAVYKAKAAGRDRLQVML
ncbi:diguanylate cyclase [Pseudomonas sp. J452]|uniref:diguanylate cyclase n=1 Tax=Pseudomonas sp. J452 TaxID=2898441 RepID=UPI0021AE167E|nr:diguanylate cyclase [Pseudomonas sp. J452]UUY07127.1 diguanylate cyclase [Pseudomonas sp. J452]